MGTFLLIHDSGSYMVEGRMIDWSIDPLLGFVSLYISIK